MRKLTFLSLLLIGIMALVGCKDRETYADQKNRERAAISKYVADSAVKVISEEEFARKNYTTDVKKNEFVLFESNGVYMQIVRKGCGSPIKNGERVRVLCRFTERNMMTDSIEVSNVLASALGYWVDKMSVTNNSGTFTGSFVPKESTLVAAHGLTTSSVPQGWLVPLTFINVGRPANEGDEVAKGRIIVPHDVGHMGATSRVIPYMYDITYQRGL